VLKYGDGLDKLMMLICSISAVGAGIAMPLMFLVFGKLVGNFTGYFTPGAAGTAGTQRTPMTTNDTNSLLHMVLKHAMSAGLVPRAAETPMSREEFMRAITKNT
jgi:ATP-binding cassette subfamily B (MDR/TAP) protein 1